jgi:hypothetical protein
VLSIAAAMANTVTSRAVLFIFAAPLSEWRIFSP